MLDEINQRSQNFHAETLLRNLGAQTNGLGSVEGGRRAERKFLKEMGLDPADYEGNANARIEQIEELYKDKLQNR